ncbi:MAG: LexA family transcriptional regulator [Thermodesulfobacteriota bacterium]
MGSEFDAFYHRAESACGVKSQSELASLLGVHRSAVTQAKNKGSVPRSWVLTLARQFGADPEWLLTGRGGEVRVHGPAPEGYVLVPKVRARLSAGGGSLETESGVDGYFSFQSEWLRRKGRPEDMVLMDVVGVSMEPEIRHGDLVLVDQSQTRVFAHAVYAFGVDDTVLVKRVEKRPGALVLLSDNKDYAPIELRGQEAEGLRVIGRVIWIGREL